MDDRERNTPEREAWSCEVLLGWVHNLGAYQMGFSLTPAWQPPPDLARLATQEDYLSILPRMHFPEKLTNWLLEQFMLRRISAISVVRFQNRWLVHIGLALQPLLHGDIYTLVDDLTVAAGLPLGSDGRCVAEMEQIQREYPEYHEIDVRYHWLGDRVQAAVQKMFDTTRE